MAVAQQANRMELNVRSFAFGAPVVEVVALSDAIAFAVGDGSVRFFGGDGAESVAEPHDGAVLSAVAAEGGSAVLTGGDDGRVFLSRPDGLAQLVAESPGRWIDHVAASQASSAVAWNSERTVHLRSPDGRIDRWEAPCTPGGIAFDGRGRRLAVAHYGGVSLWLPKRNGEALRKLVWKGSHIALTWSPDGKYIVTGMQEHAIHGWRLSDGAEMRMSGYSGKPRSLSWSPDGKWLASSGAEAAIVWPFMGAGPWGRAPDEIGMREARVTCLAFHPSRDMLACGYADGAVELFFGAATALLVADIEEMVANWRDAGQARVNLAAAGPDGGLSMILTGLGSLSYGEMAGERIKLGLLLHDPEEEHDCFSDNTHNSHYYDQVGMMAIWNGEYKRTDGSVVEGPSLRDLTAAKAPEAAARLDQAMQATLATMDTMKEAADSGAMAYDQMLAAGNDAGGAMLQAVVDGLVSQTRAIEGVVAALDLRIAVEGSDSLDDPAAVISQ